MMMKNVIIHFRSVSACVTQQDCSEHHRIGIWRLLHSDYVSNTEEILPEMRGWNVQPEIENFMLTELIIGI